MFKKKSVFLSSKDRQGLVNSHGSQCPLTRVNELHGGGEIGEGSRRTKAGEAALWWSKGRREVGMAVETAAASYPPSHA